MASKTETNQKISLNLPFILALSRTLIGLIITDPQRMNPKDEAPREGGGLLALIL